MATPVVPLGYTFCHHRVGGFSFLGWVVGAGWSVISRLAYGPLSPIVEQVFWGLAKASEAFPDARAFYSYQFRQVFILGLMLVASGTVLRVSRCPIFAGRWGGRRPIWLFMAAVTMMLDLYLANMGFHTAVSPDLLAYKPAMVAWLEQQPGQWRLTSFAPNGDKPFNANSAWLFDLEDIRGYDSIIPKQYTDYMAAIEPQNELQFNRVQPIANWESLNSPLLDALTVKYIISSEAIDLPKLKLAWEGENLRVYENLSVAPRAFTLPQTSTAVVDDALLAMTELDPRHYVVIESKDWQTAGEPISNLQSNDLGSLISNPYTPATIDAYGSREVIVSASVTEPAWLILNDSYFSGWKAFVRPLGGAENEESEVPIIRVNGNFRGVMLEPGEWAVRFRYSPTSFQLGGLTSFMAVIIIAFALGVWAWRFLGGSDGQLSTTRSIAKNSAAPMVLSLFNKAIDFVFAAFYLRLLGPAEAGSFATAIAMAGIFEILSNFGLDILLIRDVSKEHTKASSYLLNSTILRLGAAVIAVLPMLLLVGSTNLFSNPFNRPEIIAILLIMAGMVFSGMSKGVTGLFYVYEKAEIPAAMTTTTTILKVGFGVIVLLLGFSFVGLAAVSILVNIITLIALVVLALRNFTCQAPGALIGACSAVCCHLGFPLMLIHLLQTVFISVDVYLLRLMLDNGEEVVGWYSSAYKWFNALQVIPSFSRWPCSPSSPATSKLRWIQHIACTGCHSS